MTKIAVITGAGAGVGRAAAEEFARQGYDVALLSRDPARLDRAATELEGYGIRALALPTDVAIVSPAVIRRRPVCGKAIRHRALTGRPLMRRGPRTELGSSLSCLGMHQRTRPRPSGMSSG